MKLALLKILLVSAVTIGFLALAFHLNRAQRQNEVLKNSLELLESEYEAEVGSYRQQRDSIQVLLWEQERLQERLKAEIHSLGETKANINQKYHEQKHAILRIRAVDSLYNEVARHYRP